MYYILFLETMNRKKTSNFSHYVKMVSSVKTVCQATQIKFIPERNSALFHSPD